MNKKKVYTSVLAIALSIGTFAPASRNFTRISYASEITIKEDKTSEDLKKLVDEFENIKDGQAYKNSTKVEKEAYEKAINEAKENTKTDQETINALFGKIQTAKASLGNSFNESLESREALSISLVMADKLAKETLDETSKNALTEKINSAKSILEDVEKTTEEIDAANSDLNKTMSLIIEEKALDTDKLALKEDELENINKSDAQAYASAHNKLFKLQKEAYNFYKENKLQSPENASIKDINIVKPLSDAINKVANVLGAANVSSKDLIDNYNELLAAYNKALESLDSKNTELSRLTKELENLVNENPSNINLANKLAQNTYKSAIANGKNVLNDTNKDIEKIQKAINSIKVARLSLKPVKTETVDAGKSTREEEKLKKSRDELKALFDENKKVTESDAYKNAKKEDKEFYDTTISNARLLLLNNDAKLSEIDQLKSLISTALRNIGYNKSVEIKTDIEKLIEDLNKLVNENKELTEKVSYKNASEDKKKAYDNAISKAKEILATYANDKNKVSKEDLENAIADIKKAQGEIFIYKDKLSDLIKKDSELRNSEKYKAKSTDQNLKEIIGKYEELIEKAKKDLKENKEEFYKEDYEKLSEYIKFINSEIGEGELALRDKVRSYKDLQAKESYKNFKNSTEKDKKELIKYFDDLLAKAEEMLKSKSKDDKAMKLLSQKLDNAIITINNPKEENIISFKITMLMDQVEKLYQNKAFQNTPQIARDRLKKAVARVGEIKDSTKKSDLESILSDLEAALNVKEFQDILNNKTTEENKPSATISEKEIIEKLIAEDLDLKASKKYQKAQKSLREAYDKALADAKKLIEQKDSKDEDLKKAKDELLEAKEKLDGDKFDERKNALVNNYNDNASKITDLKLKASIKEKIESLIKSDKTMDDLIEAEKLLTNAIPKAGANATIRTTTPITTTTPVTTTRKVPSTVNPGSIVRTGIESLAPILGVLAVALGGYFILGKKDKNKKNK